jgi:hypothetical protein
MNENLAFFHVYSASIDGYDLTKEADAEAERSWFCAGCNSPKPSIRAIDVRISSIPGSEPLNAVVHWRGPMASMAFLDALGTDLIQRDLYLGRVCGPDGQELREWATLRGKHRLTVRGTKNVSYRRCAQCGRDVYFAMGKKYLYPGPPPDIAIFESDLCGLVLTEETFLRAGVETWRGL